MRTIYSLLAEIEKNAIVDMELTEDLSMLQTILSTFNDHVKPFKNIQMIEGNDRYVVELKKRIGYFLVKQGYWDSATDPPSVKPQHQHSLRKICLFLLYNTDTEGNHIVESSQQVCHLVGPFPRLTKCVFYYLVRELQLFPHFCEFLQYGPNDLVVHFLDSELLNSLKYMDCYDRLEKLAQLIPSVYHHCWLRAFEASCEDVDSREEHFEKINDFLATLFLSHVHANRDKYPELKKQLDFDTFVGQLLRHTLRPIIRCLETYLAKSIGGAALDMDTIFPVFQVSRDRVVLGVYQPDEFLLRYFAGMNSLLLNRVQLVLMTVSCNTFMNWVEVDLTKTVTLQRAVGELAHQLMHVIASHEKELNHDIVEVLKGLSVKPLNAQEIAKEANIPELIDHIEDTEDRHRKVWMREFISRGLFVLDNEECLSVISEHAHLLSIDDLNQFTEFLKDNVGTELSDLPKIVDIISSVLASSESVQEVESFLEREEPFRVLLDYDFCPDKYFHVLTQFLNKLVDLNEERAKLSSITPFIAALMIDPPKTILEVQNSCIRDTSLVANGLRVLAVLKGLVSNFMDDLLAELVESRIGESDALKGLELYVVEVFAGDFVNKEEFLKRVLFPEIMKRAEEKEKSRDTLSLLSILKVVLDRGTFQLQSDLRAPFVVGLGQVADAHRWDLMGYTDTEERIVTMATDLIGVIGGGGAVVEGKHKSFILHKSHGLKELNRYYVEKLFPENESTTFVRYLHAAPFATDKSRRDFLCKTFVRATLAEKVLLSECAELQPHFIHMMLTIAKAIAEHEKLLMGFRGTFSGFLKLFKEKLVDSLPLNCTQAFIELVSIIPLDIYVEQTFVVNGLIAKILERSTAENNEELLVELQQKIKQFPESSAKSHLLECVQMG